MLELENPPVRGDRKTQFEAALTAPVVFDYYGLERGGHHAVLKWLLTCGPQPHMNITMANTARPKPFWYHPSGWFTTAVDPPQSVSLTYGADVDLNCQRSRLEQPNVILCVRDIRNLLASRIKWNITNEASMFRVDTLALKIWEQYAKQAIGEIDHFDGSCVSIVYDKWFQNPEYQTQIISQVNEKFGWSLTTDGQTDRVLSIGGGSSFDKRTLENSPEQMDVLKRWEQTDPLEIPEEYLELNAALIN